MWLFNHIFYAAVVSAVVVWLTGCGFTPMYGGDTGHVVANDFQQIEIANIPDRDGVYLRNLLIDRIYSDGRPADAPYLLTVTKIHGEITNFGIRKDATSTRGLLQMDAHMALTDKRSGALLLERDYRSVGAYNQLDNQFATLVSKNSLKGHVLEEMGDNIVNDIGLYFRRGPAAQQGGTASPGSTEAAPPMTDTTHVTIQQ